MSKSITITDATFDQEVLNSDVPVLADFHADWCGPCQVMNPVLEEIATEADGRFTVAKINVDDNVETARALEVQSIPTLVLFQNGVPVHRWTGTVSKQTILDGLSEHLAVSGIAGR